MEKRGDLSHISYRSVRISEGENIQHLLGTGVLLTRGEGHLVWVLTCCHVLQEEDKSTVAGFRWITDINIENPGLGCKRIVLKEKIGAQSASQGVASREK